MAALSLQHLASLSHSFFVLPAAAVETRQAGENTCSSLDVHGTALQITNGNAPDWPEAPAIIAGKGRHGGKPPRGAGVIAICQAPHACASNTAYVCVVEKRNGKLSFPKGGRNPGELVRDGALREWFEEAGIHASRLQIQHGLHLDEADVGVRYLVAYCSPPDPNLGPDLKLVDTDHVSWIPPCEDPTDSDPIVKAHWLPVDQVIAGHFHHLHPGRCQLLKDAMAILKHPPKASQTSVDGANIEDPRITDVPTVGKVADGPKIVSRMEIADLIAPVPPPSATSLTLDETQALDNNPDVDTSAEAAAHMAVDLAMCRKHLDETFPSFKHSVVLQLHPPVYTCEQAARLCKKRPGVAEMKNLFLRDKKKKFFLISALEDTVLKLNNLPFGKSPGFASPDQLLDKLHLLPGSVSPFGLLNDTLQEVEYYLDARAIKEYNFVSFHPNSCAATVVLHKDDFIMFIETVTKHRVNFLQC